MVYLQIFVFHNYNCVQDVSSKYKVLSNPKQF